MSNVYNLEPPTQGKVVLHTTLGALDIELWPKEAPKAVRNFVQLCLLGYYDGTLFHRVIRDYMVQGGDPTGSGTGGESIYGELFRDEFHQRLKFNHRGLVACANKNEPHTNGSQFFITLDKCDWLDRKNTIFGKVVGDTIYNLARFNEVDTDPDTDRPYEPPIINSVEVLQNPFEDIRPRALPAAAQAAQQQRRQAEEEARQQRATGSRAGRGGAKASRNLALLSFGEEGEEEEEEEEGSGGGRPAAQPRKRIKAAHDVLKDDRLLQAPELEPEDPSVTAAVAATRALLGSKARASQDPAAAHGGKELLPQADRDFGAAMRARLQDKRSQLGGQGVLPPPSSGVAPSPHDDEEGGGGTPSRSPSPPPAAKPNPLQQRNTELEELRKEKRAYGKLQTAGLEVADADLLKSWEVSRLKYKQRKQAIGGREKTTLARLAVFASKLATVGHGESAGEDDAATGAQKAEDAQASARAEDAGYDGKVRSDIDHKTYMPAAWRLDDYLDAEAEDVDVAELSRHKLTFALAPGAKAQPDSMDDYVVLDPLLEKAKGKFSKAAQAAKKRVNEWAGRSNT